MVERRHWVIAVGHTYGIGSLKFRTRTVTRLVQDGRYIEYTAGRAPVSGDAFCSGLAEGRKYLASRREFINWMRKMLMERNSNNANA